MYTSVNLAGAEVYSCEKCGKAFDDDWYCHCHEENCGVAWEGWELRIHRELTGDTKEDIVKQLKDIISEIENMPEGSEYAGGVGSFSDWDLVYGRFGSSESDDEDTEDND